MSVSTSSDVWSELEPLTKDNLNETPYLGKLVEVNMCLTPDASFTALPMSTAPSRKRAREEEERSFAEEVLACGNSGEPPRKRRKSDTAEVDWTEQLDALTIEEVMAAVIDYSSADAVAPPSPDAPVAAVPVFCPESPRVEEAPTVVRKVRTNGMMVALEQAELLECSASAMVDVYATSGHNGSWGPRPLDFSYLYTATRKLNITVRDVPANASVLLVTSVTHDSDLTQCSNLLLFATNEASQNKEDPGCNVMELPVDANVAQKEVFLRPRYLKSKNEVQTFRSDKKRPEVELALYVVKMDSDAIQAAKLVFAMRNGRVMSRTKQKKKTSKKASACL